MRAGKCICCALVVGMLVFSASVYAQGPEYRWMPVDGCSTHICNVGSPEVPCECIVEGCILEGTVITLEVGMSDWGDAVGSPNLGTYQATIDGVTGYISGGNGVFDGVYGDNDDLGPAMSVGDPASCFIDSFRPNYVFTVAPPCVPMPAVSITQVNYELGGTIMGGCSITDPENSDGVPSMNPMYGGTVKVFVPPGAYGTYTIPFNPAQTKTFMNDPFGVKILPLSLTSVMITIPTGACCAPLGPGEPCYDDVTETQCQIHAGWPGVQNAYFFYPGQTCAQVEPCPVCTSDIECDDGNACTDDTCVNYVCYNVKNYDDAVYCCDWAAPGTPTLDALDDDDQCTSDYCDPTNCHTDGTCFGAIHDAAGADGWDCVPLNACMCDSVCVDGECIGDLAADVMEPCESDADCDLLECAGWFCNTDTGYCDCRLSTPICIDFLHVREHMRHHTDPCCFDEGDLVEAVVAIEAGTAFVTGGQFLIDYDADCFEFVGVYGLDPFLTVIDMDHEPGLIWIAVVALDPTDPTILLGGSPGPADMVQMDFIMKGDLACCEPSAVCLISDNPRNTKLVNFEGDEVDIDICPCEPCPRLNGDITLVTPAPGFAVNADCGYPTAIIEWDEPSASDTCDGPLEVVCVAEHNGIEPPELPVDHLIMGGGEFPQGITYFICTATNSCGDTASAVWTVDVSDQNAIDVEVHLSPVMNPGQFSRCICFDLYGINCASDPVTMCEVLDFGPPYNFPAHARALLKVDKGNYLCVAAYDPLHTICAEAMIECVDNMWVAVFKGDPLAGGNWLIGGNLNNDEHIDVLDAGTYMYEIAMGAAYVYPGNTDCDTEAPHGDINADGAVDAADYTFIVENFLMACKSPCCDEPTAGADAVLDISIKELRAMGQGHLSVADLNGDGRLNTDDMTAYMQGVEPLVLDKKRSSSR